MSCKKLERCLHFYNRRRICLEEHPAVPIGLVPERSEGQSGRGRRKFYRWNKIILFLKGKSVGGRMQTTLLIITNELIII